uniref:Uncharacterized protein n=1 Tax=Meloidogyne javanica TaxID=6303 RepID=A0A915MHD7_MELJA
MHHLAITAIKWKKDGFYRMTLVINHVRNVQMKEGQTSFCAGLLNRTGTKQLQCERVLGRFQSYLLEKSSTGGGQLFSSHLSTQSSNIQSSQLQQTLIAVKLIIATLIAICAVSQFCAGIVLFGYSARANNFRLTTAHMNLFFG